MLKVKYITESELLKERDSGSKPSLPIFLLCGLELSCLTSEPQFSDLEIGGITGNHVREAPWELDEVVNDDGLARCFNPTENSCAFLVLPFSSVHLFV